MIPYTDDSLRMLASRLLTQLLPELRSEYAMSDGALVGLLMMAIADEMGEGIERRLQDISQMQRLIVDSGSELVTQESKLLASSPENYTLAAVNQLHDALTRLLIRVHEDAEDQLDVRLQQQIWDYLRDTANRHKIVAVP